MDDIEKLSHRSALPDKNHRRNDSVDFGKGEMSDLRVEASVARTGRWSAHRSGDSWFGSWSGTRFSK